MASRVVPEINMALCTGCGDCIAVCRPKALALIEGKATLARPDACNYDGRCEPVCRTGAIALPYAVVFGDSKPSPRAGTRERRNGGRSTHQVTGEKDEGY